MPDSAVRKRAGASGSPAKLANDGGGRKEAQQQQQKPGKRRSDDGSGAGFGVLDVVRVLMGVALLSSALSWFITGDSFIWGWKPWFSQWRAVRSWLSGPVYLTDSELASYDGSFPNRPIYVGLNGSLYDVSSSPQTYGPGGSYSFFSGRDAARAFITGCFESDLTPDLRGVEEMYIPVDDPDEPQVSSGELKKRKEQDLRLAKKKVKEVIDNWDSVFRGKTGRPYFYVGKITRTPDFWDTIPTRDLCVNAQDSRPKRTKEGDKPKRMNLKPT